MKLKIGILGVGAIGSVISTQIFGTQGIDLYHFNRSKIDKIRLVSPARSHDYTIDCQTVTKDIEELDWLIICLKEYHFESAKNWFKYLIKPSTKVAVIRNGINLKEPLFGYADESQILECMIDCPVQKDEFGTFHQFKEPQLTVASSLLSKEFVRIFSESELKINEVEDFKTASWAKLCESASIGAITCLFRETCRIFRKAEYVDLYQKIIRECIIVSKADGAKLSQEYADEMLKKLKSYPPEKGSSMLSDRLAGKRIELGAKNGVVSEIGRKYGIRTPLNDMISSLLRGLGS